MYNQADMGKKTMRLKTYNIHGAAIILTGLVLIISQCCFAQKRVLFNPKDYPRDQFKIYDKTYTHGQVRIHIIHVKRKELSSEKDFNFCRAWLMVEQKGISIREFYYPDLVPVESEYGLFVPRMQPSKELFMVVKIGDHDGTLKLFDKKGNVTNLPGGYYFTIGDSLLVSEYHSNPPGLIVFDLHARKLVLQQSHIPYIYQWYKKDKNYFFTVTDRRGDSGQTVQQNTDVIYVYDRSSNALQTHEKRDNWYLAAKKVKYDFDPWEYGNCGCEVN
jgi:hypothetical protein